MTEYLCGVAKHVASQVPCEHCVPAGPSAEELQERINAALGVYENYVFADKGNEMDPREALRLIEGVLHGRPEPQPGDRVRVTSKSNGRQISSTVSDNGCYAGELQVKYGTATVEVIESAPPREPRVGHPTTDPGDGRSKCDGCGRYVFRVTHSCSGIGSRLAPPQDELTPSQRLLRQSMAAEPDCADHDCPCNDDPTGDEWADDVAAVDRLFAERPGDIETEEKQTDD